MVPMRIDMRMGTIPALVYAVSHLPIGVSIVPDR